MYMWFGLYFIGIRNGKRNLYGYIEINTYLNQAECLSQYIRLSGIYAAQIFTIASVLKLCIDLERVFAFIEWMY